MRARIVACVLLLAGAVTGGAPCLAWPGPAAEHTCCTPMHCHDAMSSPMEASEPMAMPPMSGVVTSNAAASSPARGIPRCCTSDRDASQPPAPKTLVTASDWSIDLQSARVFLHAAAISAPRLLRDPVPLAPASTARHLLFSVFIV